MRTTKVIGLAAGALALAVWQPVFAQGGYGPGFDPGTVDPETDTSIGKEQAGETEVPTREVEVEEEAEFETEEGEVEVEETVEPEEGVEVETEEGAEFVPEEDVEPTPLEEAGLELEEEAEYQEEYFATDDYLITGLGVAVQVGGGIMDYADQQMRDLTATAGAWDARVTVGTRSPLAVEAAYIGSAQSFDGVGVDPNAILLTNGASGAIRFNLVQRSWQPYLLAGAGWRRYVVTNTDINTSALRDSDNVFEVPVGAGVAYRMAGFMADLRFDYRLAFDDELIRTPIDDPDDVGNGLDNWHLTLSVGVEF